MLRFRSIRKHIHHTVARFIYTDHNFLLRRMIDAQAHRSSITHVGVHPARSQRERVQPAILLVDPDAEPGRRGFGRTVGSVTKSRLGTI